MIREEKGLRVVLLITVLLLAFSPAAVFAGAPAEEPALYDRLPEEYCSPALERGTVEAVEYPSRDYAGGMDEITKTALVYLPAGYSEDNLYDVLVLCHGIGGTEEEWGFSSADSTARNLVDRLTEEGAARPWIIVMPNCRATAAYRDTGRKTVPSFYLFGSELRNDLLPWIDSHYSTYGSLTPQDPAASREHRAIAGLSMGAMVTVNIGLCECADLFASFGAFSAPSVTFSASVIARKLESFDRCPVRLFYCVCGAADSSALGSSEAAAKRLPQLSGFFSEENRVWQVCPGKHSFGVWHLGLFNFLRLMGN